MGGSSQSDLGDNYPLRRIDQAFQEALVLRGADRLPHPPEPAATAILTRSSLQQTAHGRAIAHVHDAAINSIASDGPVRSSFTSPSTAPTPRSSAVYKPYRDSDLSNDQFPTPKGGHRRPVPRRKTWLPARVYGMVTQHRRQCRRPLAKSRRSRTDTIVVF